MEDVRIAEFLRADVPSSGSGYGFGYGFGDGSGSGSGYGSGYGSGSGSGSGSGYGFGEGSGYGSGDGSGSGSGYGFGDGSGAKTFCGEHVHLIDGVQTILRVVRGSMAKGAILMEDLTLKPCFVVKQGSVFAHGDTLRAAREALLEKLFDDMPEEERIAAFTAAHNGNKTYPNTDFFDWHHKLTGSCEAGRKAFAENHGVDMSAGMTVMEFIALTEHDYGGATIHKLRQFYEAALGGGGDG